MSIFDDTKIISCSKNLLIQILSFAKRIATFSMNCNKLECSVTVKTIGLYWCTNVVS